MIKSNTKEIIVKNSIEEAILNSKSYHYLLLNISNIIDYIDNCKNTLFE